MSWDTSTPADNEAASQGASRTRAFKTDIATALTAEGSFPVDAANPKFYPKLNKDTTANRPAASSSYTGRMFFNSTTGTFQRVKDDGSGWEDVYVNPATQSLHAAAQQTLASSAGVLTLNELGNSVKCTGTEAITSVAGWSAGVVVVQWASARILTYGASLLIQGALSRNVVANDISILEFFGANAVREIGFFGALSGKEAGELFPWAGASAPAGSLECDGSSLLRADYPRLYSQVGTVHGAADGTHFNVPDLRGKFVRGYDHAAGNDPDAASRTAPTGGASGDNVGSLQPDGVGPHTHLFGNFGSTIANGVGNGKGLRQSANDLLTDNNTGTETRPKNVSLMYCIKF